MTQDDGKFIFFIVIMLMWAPVIFRHIRLKEKMNDLMHKAKLKVIKAKRK